jgi:tetratricopeptide (TPR) repeat protein
MERPLIGEAVHSVPLVTPRQNVEPISPLDSTDFIMSTIGLSTAARGSLHRKPQFEYQLGNLSLAQGEFEDAAASFRRVLAHQPDFAEAHNNLGIALSKLGRPRSFCLGSSVRRSIATRRRSASLPTRPAPIRTSLSRSITSPASTTD